MKKIIHFEMTDNIGGIETFVLNLYNNIDRQKYQFDFITTFEEVVYKKEIETLGGHLYKVPPYTNVFAYARAIKNILKRNDYDVIHIHKNSAANIIPALIAKRSSNAKVIVHSHNTLPTKGTAAGLMHKLNRSKLYRLADIHLACSDKAGKWMFRDKEYKVIPNGVDASRFQFSEKGRNKIREEFSISKNALVIGNVGRFAIQKNHKFLVDIFESLFGLRENVYLLLVGTGELETEIRKQVNDRGISNNVIFTGKRNDIPDILSALDIFIMTSFYEGLPIVAVEAQANGVKEILCDEITEEVDIFGDVEWFSLNDSPEKVADKLVHLQVRTIEERCVLKNRLDKSEYSLKNTVNLIESIYERS